MTRRYSIYASVLTFVFAVAALTGTLVTAQTASDEKVDGGQGAPQLPPGSFEADMMACIQAGMPGKMHKFLASQVGVWTGRSQMWMGPAAPEPIAGSCTWTVESLYDGRYIKCELNGELPGMGPFSGLGLTGFDNVSQKFVGSWIDDHSSGILQGVGELSKDGKQLDWTYSYNCPITKRPTVIRQVDHYTNANAMSFEMFTTDPRSGKEYKCMQVEFTRQ